MAWVRTEDGAPLHPKMFRAGMLAYGFWHACLSYCNRYLTDGFIPGRDLVLIFPGATPSMVTDSVECLVREGLLEVGCEGYRMHDFSHYQPLKKEVLKTRRERAASGRQGGVNNAKRHKQFATARASAFAEPPTRPDPTRPDPVNKTSEPVIAFKIPGTIVEALNQCPTLGGVSRLRAPEFWQTEVRANPTVNIAQCLLDAEAWLKAKNVHRKNYAMFVHNWLRNQERV